MVTGVTFSLQHGSSLTGRSNPARLTAPEPGALHSCPKIKGLPDCDFGQMQVGLVHEGGRLLWAELLEGLAIVCDAARFLHNKRSLLHENCMHVPLTSIGAAVYAWYAVP